MTLVYYGWTEGGKWFLSVFPQKAPPRNQYETKEEAEAEAARRKRDIKWL